MVINLVKVKEDLTGKTFGRLTVLGRAEDYVSPKGYKKAQWVCQCSCQNKTIITVFGSALTKKKHGTRSCGCLQKEAAAEIGRNKRKCNDYELNLEDEHGLYGIGYCTNTNSKFYFDMDDYDKIKNYTWSEYVTTNNYHTAIAYDSNSKKCVRMHHIIVGKYYDHHDRNSLNNRRYNLIEATTQENNRNASKRHDNKSGYSGVFWHKKQQKWHAYIRKNGKRIHLGSFILKEDAIIARLKAEKEYYGEFAPQRDLFDKYNI